MEYVRSLGVLWLFFTRTCKVDSGSYLENLLRIWPADVVSKKLIGDRSIAEIIRSCNLREACTVVVSSKERYSVNFEFDHEMSYPD
jgi:hypothetical protein